MFGGSSIPEFGQPARFGQNTSSLNRNPFATASNTPAAAPARNPFAVNTPAGNSLGGSVGNSSPFNTSIGGGLLSGNSSNSNTIVGTGLVFGQRSNTNKGNNPFSLGGPSSNSSPFSSSSGTSGWGTKSFDPSVATSPAAFGTNSSLFAGGVFSPSPDNGAVVTGPINSSTVAPLSSEKSIVFGRTIYASSSKNAFGTTAGPLTAAAKYAPTKAKVDSDDNKWKNLISISAMPCVGKSHEELRFEEDYQLSVDKGSKSIATLAPVVSTGSSFNFQTQSRGLSTMSPTKLWGNFPSSAIPSSKFQSQQLGGFSTSFSVNSQSQPHSSSTISTGTEAQFKFPSSIFFPLPSQIQPNVSSITSTGTGSQSTLFSSISSGLTFKTQPQAIPSIFSTPVQNVTSNVVSSGAEHRFPSSNSLFLTLQSQPQTLTPLPAGPWNNLPSTGTSIMQTRSPIVSSWTKPEQIVDPLPANYAITNKTSEQPSSGNSKLDTHNPCTGLPQNTISIPTSAVANPFGERKSTCSHISSISVPCGISSSSISENPTPVKRISILSARNLTLRRTKLSFEKYKPKEDVKKVPFYEARSSAGLGKAATTSLTPRQNPRAWVLNPMEEGSLETRSTKSPLVEKSSEFETGNSNDK